MATPTQKNRLVQIKTPLDDDELLFSEMRGKENLSELFDYDLELLSTKSDIDLNELLGEGITISLERPDGDKRFFHGHFCSAVQHGVKDDLYVYTFSVRPWLWFLTRTADCKIHKGRVPEIIMDVFRSSNFSDFDDKLVEVDKFEKRNFCVQYRETDFDFVSRLMEQEGIYYYFRHENGKHTLVLCNDASGHEAVEDYEKIPFYAGPPNPLPDVDHFDTWSVKKQVQPGKVVTGDFNFVKPGDNMIAEAEGPAEHAGSTYEVFDYTGEYISADNGVKTKKFGDRIAKIRMEAMQASHEIALAEGEVFGPGTGDLFSLVGSEIDERNREYLIINANISLSQGGYTTKSPDAGIEFFAQFQVLSTDVVFRAPRKTPKPIIQGPQTAIVVGKPGEEIWTDKHGRVKLQFHWDRYGKSNESSSCWVRVSQAWAGTKFGAMHIPRIDQEVIVEFLNGDPDQPIVTGRVYNGDNEVPYDLPANQTQSGIKSRSSKGGSASNFNEIRMEDKKGKEELYIHAEKNHTQVTENDRSESVGHDRTLTVGNNKTETVEVDKTVTVKGTHTETITGDTNISITEGKFENQVLEGDAFFKVLKGNAFFDVDKGTCMHSVYDGELILFCEKKGSWITHNEMEIKSDLDMMLESDTKLTLKVGDSQIVITPDKIEISSQTVEVKGSAKVLNESGGPVEVKGGTVAVNGSSGVTIDGSSVDVNC